MQINTTVKDDWLNDFLAKFNFYVSSHKSFNARLSLDITWDISVRFIGNASIGYQYFLLVLMDSKPSENCTNIINNYEIQNFIKIFNGKFPSRLHLLFSYNQNGKLFFIASSDYMEFKKYDESTLSIFFENINPKLTRDVGTNKRLNKSQNDSFQEWTRSHLSRYVTVNDFDAIYIKGESLFFLELKRINPAYNTLETWKPYCNDYGNYRASVIIRNQCGISYDSFRVVTYMEDCREKISVFVFTENHLTKGNFQGEWDIVAPKKMFSKLSRHFTGCK